MNQTIAPAQGTDDFGSQLVGRLLSLTEIDTVGGGDYGMCGPYTQYSMSGGSSYTQSGGDYKQSGGSYNMKC
ncbi:MAG: hypothetical protein ACK5PF_10860 [bacterium]